VIAAAPRSGTVVYGVDAGRRESAFLASLTAATGGRVLRAASPATLRARFEEIIDEFRFRYLLGYVPLGVAADGWHRLEVRLRGRGGNVRARPGYQRGTPMVPRKTASAARWPLTTALSIVPGRPVSIQSPAR
jgi:hypothetical protein